VHAVVTWIQTNDEQSAADVLDSQCLAVDRQKFREQTGFDAEGSGKSCAGSGKVDGADSATMAASSGVEVVTVRLSSLPPGRSPVMPLAQDMLEGVLSSLAGS